MLLGFSAIALLLGAVSSTQAQPLEQGPAAVHLYNWWDYITTDVTKRLDRQGFKTKLTVYMSNEVAITRLTSGRHDFDVAIVSSLALPYLQSLGLIETGLFQKTATQRDYIPLVSDSSADCLPYLWSSTVFAANEKETPLIPTTLRELVELKKQGYNVGIVDDLYETAARLIGDSPKQCPGAPNSDVFTHAFDDFDRCHGDDALNALQLEPKDFVSSISELLAQPKVAVYGWHGEVLQALSKYPDLAVRLSKQRPVIGYDTVCILKRKNRKTSLAALVRYVELLTNKANTELNMAAYQYFSPYRDHTTGLAPKSKQLYVSLASRLARELPILVTTQSVSAKTHERLTNWWKSVRYAQ